MAVLALTVTGTGPVAFAVQDYLQLQSFDVKEQDNGAIDVQIKTEGDIPTREAKSGFGYAVLTDVGDEEVENALVAVTHIGFVDFDEEAAVEENEFHTHVLDLTGSVSGECEDSNYEVDLQSSAANEAFDPGYPLSIENNKITIEDVQTDDLAGDNVKAVVSFTAEAIFDGNNGDDVEQICIDIEDILQAGGGGTTNDEDKDPNKNDNVKDDHDDEDDNRSSNGDGNTGDGANGENGVDNGEETSTGGGGTDGDEEPIQTTDTPTTNLTEQEETTPPITDLTEQEEITPPTTFVPPLEEQLPPMTERQPIIPGLIP
ncbi:MAG TPA: hypothetical protein VIP70_07280 [Nitrososphaeraceae archaeon]